METTLYGVIQVDPKQLLEEGVRRELVEQTAAALDKVLVFNRSRGVEDVLQALNTLQGILNGYRVSFECALKVKDGKKRLTNVCFVDIQDYLNIYALKIWQEELSRIINFNVERVRFLLLFIVFFVMFVLTFAWIDNRNATASSRQRSMSGTRSIRAARFAFRRRSRSTSAPFS